MVGFGRNHGYPIVTQLSEVPGSGYACNSISDYHYVLHTEVITLNKSKQVLFHCHFNDLFFKMIPIALTLEEFIGYDATFGSNSYL